LVTLSFPLLSIVRVESWSIDSFPILAPEAAIVRPSPTLTPPREEDVATGRV
jgi:hypothetical protein